MNTPKTKMVLPSLSVLFDSDISILIRLQRVFYFLCTLHRRKTPSQCESLFLSTLNRALHHSEKTVII